MLPPPQNACGVSCHPRAVLELSAGASRTMTGRCTWCGGGTTPGDWNKSRQCAAWSLKYAIKGTDLPITKKTSAPQQIAME